MADDTRRTPRVVAHRLVVGAAVVLVGLLALSSSAFAGNAGPRIAPRVASFTIPATSPNSISWTLNVWVHGTLIGSDTGTSGALTVTIPRTIHGTVQADVRRDGRWWSGARVTLSGSPGGGGPGTGGTTGGNPGGSSGGSPGGTSSGSPGSTTGGIPGGGSTGSTPATGGGANNGGPGSNGTTPVTLAASSAANGGSSGSSHLSSGTGFGGSTANARGASGPVTLATGGKTPATATATTLSFTGVGSVWTTSFGVLGLLFLGSLLMMRRRVSRVPHP